MPTKNKCHHSKSRPKTVCFGVSEEEAELINLQVKLSGLSKQTYITNKLLNIKMVVQANPRVYKALKDTLNDVLNELRRINAGEELNEHLLTVIELIATTLKDLK